MQLYIHTLVAKLCPDRRSVHLFKVELPIAQVVINFHLDWSEIELGDFVEHFIPGLLVGGRRDDVAEELGLVRLGWCGWLASRSGALVLGDVGRAFLAIRAHNDLATAAAHDEGGVGSGRSILDCFGATNRRIQSDILSDTSSVTDLALQHVTVDAIGCGFDGVLAGTAGVHELAGVLVLLGIQHVGALVAELECDLLVVVFFGALVGCDRVGW